MVEDYTKDGTQIPFMNEIWLPGLPSDCSAMVSCDVVQAPYPATSPCIHASLRFKKKLRKLYNFDPPRCQEEWDKALRDPKVRKGTDAFGYVTVAKLFTQVLDQGRQVSSTSRAMESRQHQIDAPEDLAKVRAGTTTTDTKFDIVESRKSCIYS